MENLKHRKVAELVTENIKTAHVFKKYGIDFCCGGGISIEKACQKNQLDFEELAMELKNVDKVKSKSEDYDSWDMNFLIDHIKNIHHVYVADSIPIIQQYVDKVKKVHGHHYTELHEIFDIFLSLSGELQNHLRKEEMVLFPFIRNMLEIKELNVKLPEAPFGSVKNPIRMMEDEHEKAGEAMKTISRLTNSYQPPEGACNTFRALYAKLEEFEEDLHQHIHLENNILFPKAVKLYQQLI